jgi:hypothetical protein
MWEGLLLRLWPVRYNTGLVGSWTGRRGALTSAPMSVGERMVVGSLRHQSGLGR